jgi:hypothetical protein
MNDALQQNYVLSFVRLATGQLNASTHAMKRLSCDSMCLMTEVRGGPKIAIILPLTLADSIVKAGSTKWKRPDLPSYQGASEDKNPPGPVNLAKDCGRGLESME